MNRDGVCRKLKNVDLHLMRIFEAIPDQKRPSLAKDFGNIGSQAKAGIMAVKLLSLIWPKVAEVYSVGTDEAIEIESLLAKFAE